MKSFARRPIFAEAAMIIAFGALGCGLAAQAKDKSEACCQPGRIESAEAIIAQAETFKMKASQFHTDSAALIRDAVKLRGQAGALDPNARKTYEADLAAFKAHAAAYQAHQADVEQNIGVCKATQAEYDRMVQQFTLHTALFHQNNLPNVRPPHVCKHMGLEVADAARINNQLRIDSARVANSEAELAGAEDRLQTAVAANQAADAPLAARSKVLEAERQLTGEFAALKTEYDMLANEHNALAGTGAASPPSLSKVSGKIKSK